MLKKKIYSISDYYRKSKSLFRYAFSHLENFKRKFLDKLKSIVQINDKTEKGFLGLLNVMLNLKTCHFNKNSNFFVN